MPIGFAGQRVLVAEDEFLIALDVWRTLSEAGAEVVGPASSCAAAEIVLQSATVDAAVLDVRLGDGLSLRLAHRLRQQGVPIMFISGLEQEALPQDFRDAPFLRKPFDRADLLRVVDYLLRPKPNAARLGADTHTDNR